MTMATTEELIDFLAANARPVRRPRLPLLRCAFWLALATVVLAMLGISHGIRPDLAERLQEPLFALRVAAALVTGILAAISAFLISLPDRSEGWALLPLPGVAVWFSTIGYGCLTDWVSLGPGGVHLGEAVSCFATLVLTSTPLSLAMFVMMRQVGPWRPTPVTLSGALAVAALTATALSLFHQLDATVLVLLWNLGTAALFMAFGGILCRKVSPRLAAA
jgi:hypothetical protein